jgi:hypothetical protein
MPATGDATVHAQVDAHCVAMSTTLARKERVGVYGAVLGESVAQQVTRISALRSRRLQLVYPGMVDFDINGVLKTWDPFYAAAKAAGDHAALPDPATPLTHADFDAVDVEVKLSTIQGGAVDQLLAAGVTPITPKPGGGLWYVDSLSGYNTDDTFRDFHKIRTADEVSIRLRTALEEEFVGKKSLDNSAAEIARLSNDELGQMVNGQLLRRVQPVTVAQGSSGKDYLVTAPVMLPDTTKFIYISVALQPVTVLAAQPATALA